MILKADNNSTTSTKISSTSPKSKPEEENVSPQSGELGMSLISKKLLSFVKK